MQELQALVQATLKAGRNLLPLLLVVALYQLLVARQVPEQIGLVLAGLALVAAGIGLFLRGLEMGVFPIGRGLAHAFVERGSLPRLLAFGFCLGFATVIAALGVGLAVALGSENVLWDGFGLVALASLFPIAAVMLYGILFSFRGRDGHGAP